MKKLVLLLCVSIAAGLSGKEIIFIPGWMTEGASYRQEAELLKKTFPGYQIKIWHWDSNKSWFSARDNAEKTSDDVANYIAEMPPAQQRELILIGHSLGGRCVAHTADQLKEKNIKIKQIILLGSAINCRDHRFSSCADVSIKPVFNIFCHDDYALEVYNFAEIYRTKKLAGHRAAGQRGIVNAPNNIWQFRLTSSRSLQETMNRMTAHYSNLLKKHLNVPAFSKDFQDGTNHMSSLYVAELHRIYPDAKSHKTQVIPKKVKIPKITSSNIPKLKKYLPEF